MHWPTQDTRGQSYFSGPNDWRAVGLAKQLFLNRPYVQPTYPSTTTTTAMSQWGQQPGFQYPMQTGFPGANPQFQQNPQPQQQNPQFQQQNMQFQTGFNPGAGGLVPQRTGFPGQPQGMIQPQQTGFPGSGFLQTQPTGFPGMQQQQHRPAPPVPPMPSQFQQQNQGNMLSQPNQTSRFLSPSPAMGGSPMAPLVPQVTGYVDPRLQMMSSTFMPVNTTMPYNAGGAPQLPSQILEGGLNLQQSFQQHNQGTAPPRIPWALSKGEKKSYDNIFRAWDTHGTGFISGQTALEVFGQSGLSKDDLARIWCVESS
jgi:actin cytoskeleton-regulatory complex protein PAN1